MRYSTQYIIICDTYHIGGHFNVGVNCIITCFVFRSQTTADVTRTLVSLSETGVKMSFSVGDDVSLSYPVGTHINNGYWHYVTLTLEDNQATLFLEAISGSSDNIKAVQPL